MHFIKTTLIVLLVIQGAMAAPVLDTTKQLFLDDVIIADQHHVTRTVNPVVKYPGNPVLYPTESWEYVYALLYGSVVQDGDTFRMWYHGGHGVCYAESKDGIAWSRPELGFHQIEGHETNIVVNRNAEAGAANYLPHHYEVFGVFKNPVSDDPAKRWVMGYLTIEKQYEGPREDPFHRTQRRGLGVAYSADGLQWTLGDAVATDAICDGGTHWFWEPEAGRFVLYGRTKFKPPALMEAWKDDAWTQKHHWGRAVARVESPDFMQWDFKDPATAPVVMTADLQDRPGTEIYSMQVLPYGNLYIGLVQVLHNQADTGYLDIQLAVSRDSVHFERLEDRTPFLPCGALGTWDRFNQSLANNPPLEIGDELRFYYGGRSYRHSPYDGDDKGDIKGAIGFASIKKDRFASLDGSYNGAYVKTVPFAMLGDTLHINAISHFGEIIVEALNDKDEVIATSKPISSDSIDAIVEWEGRSLKEISEPIAFKFHLKNAKLFAFWATQS